MFVVKLSYLQNKLMTVSSVEKWLQYTISYLTSLPPPKKKPCKRFLNLNWLRGKYHYTIANLLICEIYFIERKNIVNDSFRFVKNVHNLRYFKEGSIFYCLKGLLFINSIFLLKIIF